MKQIEFDQPLYFFPVDVGQFDAEARPRYRVCEVASEIVDETTGKRYPLRWVFGWSSNKANLDARQRRKELEMGEQALQKIARLLGKYNYTSRATILNRLETLLKKSGAKSYFAYTLTGSDDNQDWLLTWTCNLDALDQASHFDGIVLLCTNVPPEHLTAGEVIKKYKEQASVEQTFDFIKNPIQIRPLWLHSPRRLAGLTFLIMLSVLIASLLDYYVRQHIAQNKKLLKGLMPENRDNPYPTAEKLLKAFQDYLWLVPGSPMAFINSITRNHAPSKDRFWTSLPPYPQTLPDRGRKISCLFTNSLLFIGSNLVFPIVAHLLTFPVNYRRAKKSQCRLQSRLGIALRGKIFEIHA